MLDYGDGKTWRCWDVSVFGFFRRGRRLPVDISGIGLGYINVA